MRLSQRLNAAINAPMGYVDEDALRAVRDELAAIEEEAASIGEYHGNYRAKVFCRKIASGGTDDR